MKTASLAGAASVLLALVLTGCGQNDTPAPAGSSGSRQPAAAGSAEHPAAIAAFGSARPLESGPWTASVRTLQEMTPPAKASVPSGWSAARVTVALTNTGADIALLPDASVTVRVGELGLETVPFTGQGAGGFPEPDAGTKVAPGDTFTADVGVAVPPHSAGQRATVTLEATQAGLAQADAVFFEGKMPGSPTAPASSVPEVTAAAGTKLSLGQWSPEGVRVSPLELAAEDNGRREASLELSVHNDSDEPRSGMGITVRVLFGAELTTADTVSAGLGYHDAPIAPHRTATHTVHVSLPSRAVPGPVTVDAEQRGGDRLMFEGTLR
ncbi:hypothetical protein [Streptomyces sp. NPDC091416]|uniref:hypothetical protein n=1 Tax=Streptomyces sp. NPDC091416 TaxID=3366003 RepID=UPI003804A3DB